ncbi:MAG: TIGR02647 family protein [Kangiellaceae bacterium]|jgi:uncharacterized protein (TIGR02647 family)
MSLTPDLLDEIELLNLFDLNTTQGGLKVHHDAGEQKIAAAKRLFDKGMTTQDDGGYLTDRGVETAEHVQLLVGMLQADS